MVLSPQDKDDLEILKWPRINITMLHPDDEDRIEIVFDSMRTRKSDATVDDIAEFIDSQPKAELAYRYTRRDILEIAARYFPRK